MLSEALGFEDMKRLERMVRAGKDIADKAAGVSSRTMLGLFMRFETAELSRRFLGASTIQATGAAATTGQWAANSLTSVAPAKDVFTKAITDPKWERILYSRVPETLKDMQRTQEQMKALIGGFRAGIGGPQEREK